MQNSFYCNKPYINLHESGSLKSKISSQILYGEKFKILNKKSKFLKIKTDYDNYTGWAKHWIEFGQDPYDFYNSNGSFDYQSAFQQQLFNSDSLYFLGWDEGRAFGGSDTYYANSNADTREIRFDATSQLADKPKGNIFQRFAALISGYAEAKYQVWEKGGRPVDF